MAVALEQDIARFEVTVNDVVGVDMYQALHRCMDEMDEITTEPESSGRRQRIEGGKGGGRGQQAAVVPAKRFQFATSAGPHLEQLASNWPDLALLKALLKLCSRRGVEAGEGGLRGKVTRRS